MFLTATFSRRLAIFGGICLPAMEISRRWREWPGPIATWPSWGDDFLLSAILLSAAWLSRPRAVHAPSHLPRRDGAPRIRSLSWLTAAWGFVCGAGFGSTLAQFNHLINPLYNYQDPSGLAHGWVTLIKATLLMIGFLGLIASLREEAGEMHKPPSQ